jgi:hypothetical protein
MPAGGFYGPPGGGTEFEAKITPIVIISCIMAATGDLMFGYDVGVSGTYVVNKSLTSSSITSISLSLHLIVS